MPRRRYALLASASLTLIALSGAALAGSLPFAPGDLVVATSTCSGDASTATVQQALPGGGTVAHGVAFAPGTGPLVPEPSSVALFGAGLTLLLATTHRFRG